MKKILFIQPLIPHYRISFFDNIAEEYEIKILTGRDNKGFKLISRDYIKKVPSITYKKIEYFNIWKDVIDFNPDIVISYGEVKQLSNILLIIFKNIFSFKFIIWSHGFKNKDIDIIDRIRLMEMKLSDGVLFYTKNGQINAQKYNIKKSYYLNNTLDLLKIQKYKSKISKNTLKNKYKITTKINGIFISRFTKIKAPNLLKDIMIKIHKKNNDIGFIIIGDGEYKPNFSKYSYIYDFGGVYDNTKKSELFKIADFSIMPRGIGLSIVETFLHKLPMFTLSLDLDYIDHGVEYSYLTSGKTGYIAKNKQDLVSIVSNTDIKKFNELGRNAYKYVINNLTMEKMVNNFITGINGLR